MVITRSYLEQYGDEIKAFCLICRGTDEILFQQPSQKLSASISLVRRKVPRANSKPGHMFQHSSRGQDFLAEAGRGSFNRQDHTARRIDEVIVVVTQCRRAT